MTEVVIDGTDVRVSRLSFGTASLHHLMTSSARQRMLAAAADEGITHFDTSPYYGDGLAEADLGVFLSGSRLERTITTKVGIYPRAAARWGGQVWLRKARGRLQPGASGPVVNWTVEYARASLRASLRRLRTDYVDFLMLHEPDASSVASEKFLHWLEAEHREGTIRYWGLAGLSSSIEPWLRQASPLARVIQTRDDLTTCAADILRRHGRAFQFTYGYLACPRAKGVTAVETIRGALQRNDHGSVLFSSRRPEHVRLIASAVG